MTVPLKRQASDGATPEAHYLNPSTGKINNTEVYNGDLSELVNALWNESQRPSGDAGCEPPVAARACAPEVDDSEYMELCRDASGLLADLEYYEKNKKDRKELMDQSVGVADKLESVGVKAYGPNNISIVGLCSGEVQKIPDFRNIVFIPVIAARKRSPMLKQLELFLTKKPMSRMWVFTTGLRTDLSDVRKETQRLHRKLSKLNHQPFMKKKGVQLVFRSTELGSIERSESGEPNFHIHAHTIVSLARRLSKEEWSELLQKVRAWWKYHFKDSSKIKGAREACKYVVKPQELDKLNAFELKELHEQMFRLHLVQPMGLLKEQIQGFKDEGKKLIRQRVGGKMTLKAIKNWNVKPKKVQKPLISPTPEILDNWVISTLPPAPYFCPISEPAAIVLNYRNDRVFERKPAKKAREVAIISFKNAEFELKNGKKINYG